MNLHVMQVPQTSLQGSYKLGDGADLLHGSDLSHHPELDHPKPSAKRKKPSRLSVGYLGGLNARRPHGPEPGHLQICRPLRLRSWVNASAAHPQAGAQKILVANGRSVTQALTTGKPADRIHPNDISTEVRFPHFVEKAGDSLNLRRCALKRHTPRPAKVLHTHAREVVKRHPLGRCPDETPPHPNITDIVSVAGAWAVITDIVTTGSTVVEITMVEMPEIFPACPGTSKSGWIESRISCFGGPAEFSADVRALLAPKECRP